MTKNSQNNLIRIRLLIGIMIGGLLVSGITAFPLRYELNLLNQWLMSYEIKGSFTDWIDRVTAAVNETDQKYPFMAYGTDWLAFAHILIAIVFFGPLKDPYANRWVIDWGIIASIMVIPLALIAGPIREIPFFHRLIDCAFGVAGFFILSYCRHMILQLKPSSFTAAYT